MKRSGLVIAAFLLLTTALLRAQQEPAPLPDAPSASQSHAAAAASEPPKAPAMVNGRPYMRPTARDQFLDYLKDSYGIPGTSRSLVRAAYAQARDTPDGWGQDWPGFGQRFGSSVAVTAISGNVRYGMEELFHEDMRYYHCHNCPAKEKFRNALLAEVTARHDTDGHRFFTLTPIISDLSGPVVANSFWIPGHGPKDGLTGVHFGIITRIGAHLFKEFVQERYQWLNFKGDE